MSCVSTFIVLSLPNPTRSSNDNARGLHRDDSTEGLASVLRTGSDTLGHPWTQRVVRRTVDPRQVFHPGDRGRAGRISPSRRRVSNDASESTHDQMRRAGLSRYVHPSPCLFRFQGPSIGDDPGPCPRHPALDDRPGEGPLPWPLRQRPNRRSRRLASATSAWSVILTDHPTSTGLSTHLVTHSLSAYPWIHRPSYKVRRTPASSALEPLAIAPFCVTPWRGSLHPDLRSIMPSRE